MVIYQALCTKTECFTRWLFSRHGVLDTQSSLPDSCLPGTVYFLRHSVLYQAHCYLQHCTLSCTYHFTRHRVLCQTQCTLLDTLLFTKHSVLCHTQITLSDTVISTHSVLFHAKCTKAQRTQPSPAYFARHNVLLQSLFAWCTSLDTITTVHCSLQNTVQFIRHSGFCQVECTMYFTRHICSVYSQAQCTIYFTRHNVLCMSTQRTKAQFSLPHSVSYQTLHHVLFQTYTVITRSIQCTKHNVVYQTQYSLLHTPYITLQSSYQVVIYDV